MPDLFLQLVVPLFFKFIAIGNNRLYELKVFYDAFLQDNRITKLQYKFSMAIVK